MTGQWRKKQKNRRVQAKTITFKLKTRKVLGKIMPQNLVGLSQNDGLLAQKSQGQSKNDDYLPKNHKLPEIENSKVYAKIKSYWCKNHNV